MGASLIRLRAYSALATASSSVAKVCIERAAGVPYGLMSSHEKRPSG